LEVEQGGGKWVGTRGKVAQIMYTRVSKHKNNKIKFKKRIPKAF
jgi:hypothetical protein